MRIGWRVAAFAGVTAAIIAVATWHVDEAAGRDRRAACAANLKRIGQAMLLDGNAHGNRYPDSLATLARERPGDALTFACPADPGGDSYRLIADSLPREWRLSGSASGLYIVAIERPGHHGKAGVHVLFMDGHAELCKLADDVPPAASWTEVQDDLAGFGQHPGKLRWPASQPQ